MFYFAAFSVPMTALALPFVMTAHDIAGWLLLLAIGIAGVIGQLLLTAALRFGAIASVIVMDYSSLFWATLYGWLLFDSLPPPSTWLGAPMIIAAGLVIAWREHRLSRPTLRDWRATKEPSGAARIVRSPFVREPRKGTEMLRKTILALAVGTIVLTATVQHRPWRRQGRRIGRQRRLRRDSLNRRHLRKRPQERSGGRFALAQPNPSSLRSSRLIPSLS